MTYSIKAVAARTGLSIYTLRYYDKAGLLPFVARDASGYRAFTDGDLALLHTIGCLKATEMKLADIRHYVNLVMQGPQTAAARAALLAKHRRAVVAKQAALANSLKELDYKLAMYQAPDAIAQVTQEWDQARADKARNGLPDPFVAQKKSPAGTGD